MTAQREPTPAAAAETAATAAELFGRHRQAVRGYLLVRCRDADLADELTQDAFARIATGAVRLDPSGNASGYLITVAHNAWRDWLRRELVRRRAAPTLALDAAPVPAADAELLQSELQAALGAAIERLPAEQRDVVRLRHREQLTFQQIADRLHRPLGTVLAQMRAALQRMHETMEAFR